MPRFFKPLGGFLTKPNAKAIRIGDDGDTHFILDDGTEQRTGYVGTDQRWMPDRTITEMENLVAGGSWVEVKDANDEPGERPMSPAAAPKQTHGAGPVVSGVANKPAQQADRPPVIGGDPKSTNNPQPKE